MFWTHCWNTQVFAYKQQQIQFPNWSKMAHNRSSATRYALLTFQNVLFIWNTPKFKPWFFHFNERLELWQLQTWILGFKILQNNWSWQNHLRCLIGNKLHSHDVSWEGACCTHHISSNGNLNCLGNFKRMNSFPAADCWLVHHPAVIPTIQAQLDFS